MPLSGRTKRKEHFTILASGEIHFNLKQYQAEFSI
jgi:hypothetical protein